MKGFARLVLLVLVSGALFFGCSSSSQTVGEKSSGLPTFYKEISPFSVTDSVGILYKLPFQGGFNVPRPQFADMDGDGDPDMFIQEETGRIKHFENVGISGVPHFEWRSDAYEDLDIGEWYRVVVIDNDGDMDILTEERFSYV